MIEHRFLETGRLWPVIGPDGGAVLFQSRDSAEMYAIAHGLETGEPMPVMKAVTLWPAARMTLADDGRDYKVEPLPDAMRRADAVHQDVKLHDRMSLDVYAQTRAGALALAVEAVVRDRCAPRLAVIVHGTGRYWMGEGRCADSTPY